MSEPGNVVYQPAKKPDPQDSFCVRLREEIKQRQHKRAQELSQQIKNVAPFNELLQNRANSTMTSENWDEIARDWSQKNLCTSPAEFYSQLRLRLLVQFLQHAPLLDFIKSEVLKTLRFAMTIKSQTKWVPPLVFQLRHKKLWPSQIEPEVWREVMECEQKRHLFIHAHLDDLKIVAATLAQPWPWPLADFFTRCVLIDAIHQELIPNALEEIKWHLCSEKITAPARPEKSFESRAPLRARKSHPKPTPRPQKSSPFGTLADQLKTALKK